MNIQSYALWFIINLSGLFSGTFSGLFPTDLTEAFFCRKNQNFYLVLFSAEKERRRFLRRRS